MTTARAPTLHGLRALVTCLAVAVLALAPGCYGSAHGARGRATEAWRRGDTATALGEAEAMYLRFAEANPDAAEHARRLVPELKRSLAESPILVPGGAPATFFERDGTPRPSRRVDPDADLRARLLSLDASATLPAISSVAGLGLLRHAEGLLAVLDRREGWQDSGSLTATLDVATRSMLVKTMALEALSELAAVSPSRPPEAGPPPRPPSGAERHDDEPPGEPQDPDDTRP